LAQLRVLFCSVFLSFLCCMASTFFAEAQEGSSTVFLPNQEVIVAGLPPLVAPSTDRSAGLAAALEIVLHNKTVCCGKDSALEDVALYASLSGSTSLKELSAKLQGKHLLSDGRPILVNAEYVPQSSASAGLIVGSLTDQHALLIEWKSIFYVLYGAIFDKTRDTGSGIEVYAIHKLLLLDPRFSDKRRVTEFDRETDNWETVGGLSIVKVVPQ
jgi:hypothetical protein